MNIRTFRRALVALALGHGLGVVPAQAAGLTICLDEDNPPFSSSASGGGIDQAIGEELARRLDRSLQVHWVGIPNRGGLGKALRRAFAAGDCDLFAGVPLAEGRNEDLAEQQLASTAPYLETGYALLGAGNGRVRSPADLRDATAVGAVSATPADLYLFEHGYARHPYGSNEALLAALAADQVDAAVVWLPALARLGRGGAVSRPLGLDEPALRVPFVMALRAGSDLPARAVDEALRQMRDDGSIARIAERFGLASP